MRALTDAPSLLAFAPTWVVFWAGHVRASQFAIWAPYLRQTHHHTLVLNSGDRADDQIRTTVEGMPRCAIAEPFAEVLGWLQDVPDLRGFLYVGSYPENGDVIDAFPDAAHVWIGHGESAKGANRHRTATVYDAVFVAQPDAVLRYASWIQPWIRDGACAIGVPVVEGLAADTWIAPRAVRTILYAPTWEGRSERGDYGSLPLVAPVLLTALPALLERGMEVIVRPHSATGARVPAQRDLVRALFDAGARSEPDKAAAMTRADVLIGDVSGLTSEFLFTRKPIILPTSDALLRLIDAPTLEREYPFVYRWDVAREGLLDRIAALESHDPLAAAREVAAQRAFRGHRTLDDAVVTFELALEAARGRGQRRSVASVFEASLRDARARA